MPVQKERIAFFDIESNGGGFNAQFGTLLSYCIKDGQSKKIYEGYLNKADLRRRDGKEDQRLVKKLVEDIKRFDRLVTWYGTGFDLKFARTRAVICDVEFPSYGEIKHTDLYYVCRNRFKLTSNRLENACRALLGHTDKTHIDPAIWRLAGRADAKALGYVVDHNRKDVLDLEKIYNKIIGFSKKRDLSI